MLSCGACLRTRSCVHLLGQGDLQLTRLSNLLLDGGGLAAGRGVQGLAAGPVWAAGWQHVRYLAPAP